MAEMKNKPDTAACQGKTASAEGWDRRTNMLALLLMALATFGSSWSAYQSSLWNGKQIFRLTDAAALSRAGDEKAMTANQLRTVEASLFVEYARDLYEGRIELSDFFLARMRPEMREAIQAWIATQPIKNPHAPITPFVMPQYRVQIDDQARELAAKSSATYDQAQKANRTSDTYTLLGVLCTSALFLAGLVSGFDQKLMRQMVLALSFSVLLVVLVIMTQQPIAHRG